MFKESAVTFMVGESDVMRGVCQRIRQVAQSDITVLITGETGTGKEIAAQTIHRLSSRQDKVFTCVNCAALSETLLESELFGHDKGAFTGAEMTRLGRFELADQGTILLDEIGELDTRLQAKLLRVLETQTFERVGSSFSKKVDIRIIATTNQDLEKKVADGSFRPDLFYRLNVLSVHMPPLREHKEDIGPLVHYFMTQRRNMMRLAYKQLVPDTMRLFLDYAWPGNVRELFNLLCRVLVLSNGTAITPEDIAFILKKKCPAQPVTNSLEPASRFDLKSKEKEVIKAGLTHYGGNRLRTAEALGITDRTLRKKIKHYSLNNS